MERLVSEIPEIGVANINVRGVYIPQNRVNVNDIPNIHPPVTLDLGFPIVEMPGCVESHQDNQTKGKPWDRDLVNDDPAGSTVLCPNGQYPSYNAMNFEPENLPPTIVAIPNSEVPPAPEVAAPAIPKTDTKEDPPCPPPNAPRIGDVSQSGDEAVSAFELQIDPANPTEKICVTLYEPLTVVEKYLPSAQVVTTTAGIAAAATTSALLAKPLADLLLKVVKPVVKKLLTKVQTLLGKTPAKPSRSEVIADQYRLKKGLPPLKKPKKKKK